MRLAVSPMLRATTSDSNRIPLDGTGATIGAVRNYAQEIIRIFNCITPTFESSSGHHFSP